jgi:O-methyltransferase
MTDTWNNRLMLRLQWAAAGLSYGLTNYRHPLRASALSGAKDARRLADVASTPLECTELYYAVAACEKISGDMAEAGVYRGGTAAVMLAASQGKRLHLFDTFEGLPHDEDRFAAGEWHGSVDDVRSNLSRWRTRIELHPGLFPSSTAGLEAMQFSFVHLDLDLYDSTLAALEWFWPRIVRGGICLSHDYPLVNGVVRAFQEFFDRRLDPFVPLSGNQCLAVKTSD